MELERSFSLYSPLVNIISASFVVALLIIIGINQSKAKQTGRHFADIFTCILFTENVSVAIEISLNFVPEDPTDNKSVFILVMAWQAIAWSWTDDGPHPLYHIVLLSHNDLKAMCDFDFQRMLSLTKLVLLHVILKRIITVERIRVQITVITPSLNVLVIPLFPIWTRKISLH